MDDLSPPKIHVENIHYLNRVIKESEWHNKVLMDCSRLRAREKLFDYKVPNVTIDQYKVYKQRKRERSENIINTRFPHLLEAKKDFQTSHNIGSKYNDKPKIIQQLQNEQPANQFEQNTFSNQLKQKKILPISEDYSKFCNRFIPVNPSEAKISIKRNIIYDSLNLSPQNDISMRESTMNTSLHQGPFKRTSPSPLRESQEVAINSTNTFTTFLPQNNQNPRLSVLSNFKEISRIMTNQFLNNKSFQVINNQSIQSKSDVNKSQTYRLEDNCTNKITSIMKKLYNPSICQPLLRKQSTEKRSASTMNNPMLSPLKSLQGDSSIQQFDQRQRIINDRRTNASMVEYQGFETIA